MIDDENLDPGLLRFKPEAQLLLNGVEDTEVVRLRIIMNPEFRRRFQPDVVITSKSGLIDN